MLYFSDVSHFDLVYHVYSLLNVNMQMAAIID